MLVGIDEWIAGTGQDNFDAEAPRDLRPAGTGTVGPGQKQFRSASSTTPN